MKVVASVCHVISGYYRNDARIFLRQCQSLRRAEFDVYILTADGEPDECLDGVRVVSCVRKPASRIRSLLLATPMFLEAAVLIDADIYQIHSPELLPLAKQLKRLGKKVVYDAHEDMPNHILEKEWIPDWLRPTISTCFASYMYRALTLLDETISPHHHVVDALQAKIGKGVVIANFPIVKDRDVPTRDSFATRRRRVCYTGTAYTYSNQCAIADAISGLDGVEYSIAGHLDAKQLGAVRAILPTCRFQFLGRLSQPELAEFYQSCLVGIVIYDYKLNLGWKKGSYGTNKIFEYMEAGLPIVCTDYEMWSDIVRRYDCGICVAPGDPQAIRRAIKSLVNDPHLAFEMGCRGRVAVEREFNWATEEQRYNALMTMLATSSYLHPARL